MREVIYHPAAESEFLDSARYYEQHCEGLGCKFIFSINTSIQSIIRHPQAWPVIEDNIHRHRAKHFPYGIYYRIFSSYIRILAIAHLHRDPGCWKERT